jgi:hypothetical protein
LIGWPVGVANTQPSSCQRWLVEMENAAVGVNEFSGDRRVAAPEKVSDLRSRVRDR